MQENARMGALTLLCEALFQTYTVAIDDTDLSRPELVKNELPGKLLDLSNRIQIAVDTQRRLAAAELLQADGEQVKALWDQLGFDKADLPVIMAELEALKNDPLRYGQEG